MKDWMIIVMSFLMLTVSNWRPLSYYMWVVKFGLEGSLQNTIDTRTLREKNVINDESVFKSIGVIEGDAIGHFFMLSKILFHLNWNTHCNKHATKLQTFTKMSKATNKLRPNDNKIKHFLRIYHDPIFLVLRSTWEEEEV